MIQPYQKAWGEEPDGASLGRNRTIQAGFLPETAGISQTPLTKRAMDQAFVLHLGAFLGIWDVWHMPEDKPLWVTKGRA